jgi:Holliday junction DNA helicase RuvB
MTEQSFIQSSLAEEDTSFELPLRPQSLSEFQGQKEVCERLEVLVGAASQRGDPLSHCLFCGPPGLGKTTLANILAKHMNSNIVVVSAPVIEKAGDLAGILTNLQEGDIFFIDEIHRLSRVIEEYLYPAMEDFSLDLLIDSGPAARSVKVKLNPFTLVGATTKSGLLTSPLRSRFGVTCRLDFYSPEVLQKIIQRTARLLDVEIDDAGAYEVACRSRGTPRIANNLFRWVRDFAQIKQQLPVTKEVVERALTMLNIDERGLDELDRKILQVMIDHYGGGPVGINTIAVAVGEEPMTIEEVHEPYLILKGFIKRTPRGREVTALAYQHMNMRENNR